MKYKVIAVLIILHFIRTTSCLALAFFPTVRIQCRYLLLQCLLEIDLRVSQLITSFVYYVYLVVYNDRV